MQLNPVASTVLVIFYLVTSVALVVILGFFSYALMRLNVKLELLEARLDPLMIKAEEILTLTNSKIVSLGAQTEGILTHGEAVAGEVHEKVEKTVTVVHRTINTPIIRLNSAAAGLAQGLQTFRLLQQKQAKIILEADKPRNEAVLPTNQVRSVDLSAPLAADTAANSNGAPAALRVGRGN